MPHNQEIKITLHTPEQETVNQQACAFWQEAMLKRIRLTAEQTKDQKVFRRDLQKKIGDFLTNQKT